MNCIANIQHVNYIYPYVSKIVQNYESKRSERQIKTTYKTRFVLCLDRDRRIRQIRRSFYLVLCKSYLLIAFHCRNYGKDSCSSLYFNLDIFTRFICLTCTTFSFDYFLKMLFKSTVLLIFINVIMKSCYTAYIHKEELRRFDRIHF